MYKIGLCYNDIDISFNNTFYFDSELSKEAFYDNKILNATGYSDLVNFSFNTQIDTAFTFNLDFVDISGLNYNYCIVKNDNDSIFYYYFITDLIYLNNRQVTVKCHMDVITQFINVIDFEGVSVRRAHLNRYVKRLGLYYLDLRNDSPFIYTDENLPVLQNSSWGILDDLASEKIQTDIRQFFKNKVAYWKYYYISSSGEDTIPNLTAGYKIYCAPVFTNRNYSILIKLNGSSAFRSWNDKNLINYLKGVYVTGTTGATLYDNILSVKASPISPFDDGNNSFTYNISVDLDTLEITFNTIQNIWLNTAFRVVIYKNIEQNINDYFIGCLIFDSKIANFDNSLTYQIVDGLELFREEYLGVGLTTLKNNANNLELNPIIYNSAFSSLDIVGYNYDIYSYDMAKIYPWNLSNIKVTYVDYYTPKISPQQLSINVRDFDHSEPELNGAFFSTTTNNMDFINTTKLQEFLANNASTITNTAESYQLAKNSVNNQFTVGAVVKGVEFVSQSATAVATENPAAAPNPMSFLGDMVKSGVSLYYQNKKMDMDMQHFLNSVNDMAISPLIVKNASNDYVSSVFLDAFKYKIQYKRASSRVLDEVHKNTQKFGYACRFNDVNFFDFITSRIAFNYIECDVELIIGKVSNEIKAYIKTILNRGIRFWHTQNIDITKLNYERWLDNE